MVDGLPPSHPLLLLLLFVFPYFTGHDVTADVPVDGEDESRLGREEAQRRHRESCSIHKLE